MDHLITLADEDSVVQLLAIGGGLIIAAIAIIGSMVSRILRKREEEQSRREVAAYVAEGSMTADDAEKILRAGRKNKDRNGTAS